MRGARGLFQCGARRFDLKAPHRNAGDDQFMAGARGGQQRRRIESGQQALGRIEAAEQQQAADRKITRMRSVGVVAVF